MMLKRIFDHSGETPRVSHLRVLHAGPRQNITPRIIGQGAEEGWLSMGGGTITLKTVDGQPDLVYRIVRAPGLYCCHCETRLPDQTGARAHVAEHHPAVPSPDANNPSGYRRDDFFACVKEG